MTLMWASCGVCQSMSQDGPSSSACTRQPGKAYRGKAYRVSTGACTCALPKAVNNANDQIAVNPVLRPGTRHPNTQLQGLDLTKLMQKHEFSNQGSERAPLMHAFIPASRLPGPGEGSCLSRRQASWLCCCAQAALQGAGGSGSTPVHHRLDQSTVMGLLRPELALTVV